MKDKQTSNVVTMHPAGILEWLLPTWQSRVSSIIHNFYQLFYYLEQSCPTCIPQATL